MGDWGEEGWNSNVFVTLESMLLEDLRGKREINNDLNRSDFDPPTVPKGRACTHPAGIKIFLNLVMWN